MKKLHLLTTTAVVSTLLCLSTTNTALAKSTLTTPTTANNDVPCELTVNIDDELEDMLDLESSSKTPLCKDHYRLNVVGHNEKDELETMSAEVHREADGYALTFVGDAENPSIKYRISEGKVKLITKMLKESIKQEN